jgi:hypothetical protein
MIILSRMKVIGLNSMILFAGLYKIYLNAKRLENPSYENIN